MRSMKAIDFSGFAFREGRHNDSAVIWVDFKYDRAKIDLVKSLKGRWSRSKKCWYVPDNTHFRTLFGMKISPVGKGVLSKLSPVNARELQRMKEVLQMKALELLPLGWRQIYKIKN